MFIVIWILNAVSLMLCAWLIPGIHIQGVVAAMISVVLIGFMNMIAKPIMILLTLPLTFITLGLFLFVINGLAFWMASGFIEGFNIDGFWSAFFGAIVYSLISSFLNQLVK